MEIDKLTIGDARRIAGMFPAENGDHHLRNLGDYVIVRSARSGVHAGVLYQKSPSQVILRESRRIWSWTGALSCSEISRTGVTGGKIAVELPEITIAEWIEIIPCSQEAEKCLRSMK